MALLPAKALETVATETWSASAISFMVMDVGSDMRVVGYGLEVIGCGLWVVGWMSWIVGLGL